MEDELLGDATTHGVGQLVEDLVAGRGVLVVGRHDHRVAERPAAGQDRHLRHRVGVVHRRGDDGVSALVVGGDLALLGGHDPGALLRTRDHAVDGLVEGRVVDQLAVAAGGQQGRLVEDVGQVGTGEPGRATGHGEQVDAGGHRLALGVHLEDPVAADHVGRLDRDLAVEAAGTQQRRVEDVGAVGRRDQDDVGLDVEAVHLDQQLVEGLLALVVATAEARATVPADGVDLVDEDDGGGVGLGLLEQVADAGGADTDEHLDEVGTGDRVERHARLAGDGAREQRLAGAGRAVEQDALGDLGADRQELGRLGEELLDLVELLDGLVGTGDVGEGDLRGVLGGELGLGLAELHDARATALHLRHEEPEQAQQDDDRQERPEQREQRVGVLDDLVEASGREVVVEQLDEARAGRVDVLGADLGRVLDVLAVGVGLALLEVEVDHLVVGDDRPLHLLLGDELLGGGGVDPRVAAPVTEAEDHQRDRDDGDDPEQGCPKDALEIHVCSGAGRPVPPARSRSVPWPGLGTALPRRYYAVPEWFVLDNDPDGRGVPSTPQA